MLDDVDLRRGAAHALKALGVRLAIDDFGTGYSSLSQLGRFPVDVLKIDRSFVQAMGEAGRTRAAAAWSAAVITLAGAMGLVPVAEGVEREEQAEVLRALGCPSAQGYLFSAARDAAEVERLILAAPEPAAPLRVVVCDDAPALRALRAHAPRARRAAWRSSARPGTASAPSRSSPTLRPDVVLLDIRCRRSTASTALPRIRRAAPGAGVVVLSGCDEDAARTAGARARRRALRREARRRRGDPRGRARSRPQGAVAAPYRWPRRCALAV